MVDNFFTKSEMELIRDNLDAYVHNFGRLRIERGDDGKSFYVFTSNTDTWRQYCYNIDYLNGWLFGCVQAACGDPKRDPEFKTMQNAYLSAGYREKHAMDNGNREIKTIRGHKCYVFTYPLGDEYQDANGATYDTVTKEWID